MQSTSSLVRRPRNPFRRTVREFRVGALCRGTDLAGRRERPSGLREIRGSSARLLLRKETFDLLSHPSGQRVKTVLEIAPDCGSMLGIPKNLAKAIEYRVAIRWQHIVKPVQRLN